MPRHASAIQPDRSFQGQRCLALRFVIGVRARTFSLLCFLTIRAPRRVSSRSTVPRCRIRRCLPSFEFLGSGPGKQRRTTGLTNNAEPSFIMFSYSWHAPEFRKGKRPVARLPRIYLFGRVEWSGSMSARRSPANSRAESTNEFHANTRWYPKKGWAGSVARYSWLVGKSGEVFTSAHKRLAMAWSALLQPCSLPATYRRFQFASSCCRCSRCHPYCDSRNWRRVPN